MVLPSYMSLALDRPVTELVIKVAPPPPQVNKALYIFKSSFRSTGIRFLATTTMTAPRRERRWRPPPSSEAFAVTPEALAVVTSPPPPEARTIGAPLRHEPRQHPTRRERRLRAGNDRRSGAAARLCHGLWRCRSEATTIFTCILHFFTIKTKEFYIRT